VSDEQVRQNLMDRRRVTDTGCWEYTGFCSSLGYGQVRIDGEVWAVHRLMYTLHNGPIPERMKVLHSCDNPPCFNPDHLRVGTQRENVMDSVHRGRHHLVAGDKTYSSSGSGNVFICGNGHDMRDPANVYVTPKGYRQCRRCRTDSVARSAARRKAKMTAFDGRAES
jgi:hypothetical protein